mgnify:CR=1 FL=1
MNHSLEQITIGMLTNQTEILKKHTEILNQNQQNIAQIIKENFNPNAYKFENCFFY